MDAEQVGSFRTRMTGDGSLEVWARGWRLESPLYALVPVGLALMFVLAPMPLGMRAGGALVMLAAGQFVFRLQKPGLLFAQNAVTVVGVVRTRRIPWETISGFMGERRHDEGRVLIVLQDDERVPLPGTLDPSELDPYGEEGEVLSAVDQLNRLGERARAGQLPRPTSPLLATAKSAPKMRIPKVRPPKLRGPDVAAVAEGVVAVAPAASATADLMERPKPTRAATGPIVVRAPEPLEDTGPLTRKQRRAERQELRRALKAVKLTKDGRAIPPVPASTEPEAVGSAEPPKRRLRGRREPVQELTAVPIAEPVPEPVTSAPPRVAEPEPRPGMPSYYPTPTYIPQEEYARMLREQRAAEKAAAAAAAELRELADADDPADTEELSDRAW